MYKLKEEEKKNRQPRMGLNTCFRENKDYYFKISSSIYNTNSYMQYMSSHKYISNEATQCVWMWMYACQRKLHVENQQRTWASLKSVLSHHWCSAEKCEKLSRARSNVICILRDVSTSKHFCLYQTRKNHHIV